MTDAIKLNLAITVAALIIEIVLVSICYIQSKKPADPLKTRLLPYPFLMVVLVALILATLAHIVSLVTGQQVSPRRPKGMR
jgi:hypothetical protein